MPLISVIVPVYKVEPYLERCVRSILAQTHRELEVILVDDGSPDNCGKLCDAFAQADARVKVVHKENGGLSDARNAGLAVATAELVGFVDSDDHIDATMYERLLQAMTEADADMSLCGFAYVDEQTGRVNEESNAYCSLKTGVLSREQALAELNIANWGYHFYVTAWNKLYKRSVLGDAPFPVGKLHEDEFAAHWIFERCKKIAVVAEPLYRYMQRQGSIMSAGTTARSLDGVEAYYDRYLLYGKLGMTEQAVTMLAGIGWKMRTLLRSLPADARPGVKAILKKLIPELIKKRKLIGPYLYLCQIGYLLRIMLANGKESI